MKLFRNREAALPAALILSIGALSSLLCFLLDTRAGIVCAASALASLIVHVVSTELRYKRFRELSEDIDRLLSGVEEIDLSNYDEGEFSILENEINKLTNRIREQEAVLIADKQMLADSIADISHQIRTPLTAMTLIATALRRQEIDRNKREELLCELRRELARIEWLVSSLLKLARLDANAVELHRKPVGLDELVSASLEPIAIQMELREQTVVRDVSGTVVCDLSWTAEALSNIMKNCSEHMNNGTLYVTARENPLFSEIIIRDTGCGIDKEDLPHLFERFYRGKDADSTSVGIGLALCRMIIAKQNGTVKAENVRPETGEASGGRPAHGAIFTVRIYKAVV